VKWGFFTNYEISRGCVSSLVGELAFDRKRTFDDHEVEEPVNRCEDHHIYWSISSAGEQSRIPQQLLQGNPEYRELRRSAAVH
jgi:hypothetical protein